MKKLLGVLIIISMARIGVAYADTTSNSQNYFFGVKNAASNLNQVLALLVGPQGKPGPAGVAGKDGLIGMNGIDGKDGLPGAPGATGAPGKDGSGVLAVAFSGSQGSCKSGGVKFTSGDGVESFACNGATGATGLTGAIGPQGPAGPQGATGAIGPQGPAGTGGSGGTLGYGQGEVTAGACETDGKIVLSFDRSFTGTDFVFDRFKFGDPTVTDGDVKDTCAGKTVSIYFKISSGTLKNTSGHYANGNIIKCSYVLPPSAGWPSSKWQFNLSSGSLTCVNTANSPATSVSFSEISTADYTDTIGFEIGD